MLVAPDFQQRIATAIDAVECSVVGGPDRVTSIFVMPTAAPLYGVSGPLSKQFGELFWTTPLVDGQRQGRVGIRIDRSPVSLGGPVYLRSADSVTTVDYDTELDLDMPMLEAGAERAVANRAATVIGFNQSLGEAWLKAHGVEHPEVPRGTGRSGPSRPSRN
jgi:hypothetical protein